jgi:hypothetical protein
VTGTLKPDIIQGSQPILITEASIMKRRAMMMFGTILMGSGFLTRAQNPAPTPVPVPPPNRDA